MNELKILASSQVMAQLAHTSSMPPGKHTPGWLLERQPAHENIKGITTLGKTVVYQVTIATCVHDYTTGSSYYAIVLASIFLHHYHAVHALLSCCPCPAIRRHPLSYS